MSKCLEDQNFWSPPVCQKLGVSVFHVFENCTWKMRHTISCDRSTNPRLEYTHGPIGYGPIWNFSVESQNLAAFIREKLKGKASPLIQCNGGIGSKNDPVLAVCSP